MTSAMPAQCSTNQVAKPQIYFLYFLLHSHFARGNSVVGENYICVGKQIKLIVAGCKARLKSMFSVTFDDTFQERRQSWRYTSFVVLITQCVMKCT